MLVDTRATGTAAYSRGNSRYNKRAHLDISVGEADLKRRLRTSAGEKARHARARTLAAAPAFLAVFILAFAFASTAGAQTAPLHVKAAAEPSAPAKAYGSPNAPITMEVFSDYECPSCRNLFEQTLRPLIGSYVADGKVYLIHRDFPLPMHKYGYEAARWLNASARAGQFQAVEATLYDNQNTWAEDGNIAKFVSGAMSPEAFKRVETLMRGCTDPATAGQQGQGCVVDPYIELDRALGNKIPVQATPTFVITYKGQHLPAGSGFVSWPILKQFFDSLLGQ
jgi:protein-disulfide isomerase